MHLPNESKKECRYQELQVVVSCQKRVIESPPREQDALFTREPSLQHSANYLFVFETVRIRHHMYFYPSDEGLYSQFLCVCDQLLDRHPRQEGACQLMVSAVPGHWDKEEVEHRGSHSSSQ